MRTFAKLRRGKYQPYFSIKIKSLQSQSFKGIFEKETFREIDKNTAYYFQQAKNIFVKALNKA